MPKKTVSEAAVWWMALPFEARSSAVLKYADRRPSGSSKTTLKRWTRPQRIMEALASGKKASQVAKKFRISKIYVYRIVRELLACVDEKKYGGPESSSASAEKEV